MKKISLNGCWQGECFDANGTNKFDFTGNVPGCVHTDLAGKHIPEDIFYRNNADECQWIENCNWIYTKVFTLDETPEKAVLIFEGLDTYADIHLNSNLIGSVNNMFISHSFDVANLLKKGENKITVSFRSPVNEVEGLENRDGAFTTERMHTRRIQCTYGWDWVARFVTCGIWRDVYLDMTDGFTVKNAYIYTEQILENSAQIVVEAEFENYQSGKVVEIEMISPDGQTVYRHRKFCKEPFIKEYIDIPDAKLWYPIGYGSQPIYKLKICGKEFSFGIRTATIIQLPDKQRTVAFRPCFEAQNKTVKVSGYTDGM